MSILATAIGLALAVLPFVIGYVARSKGRSALAWNLLSVILTPFGSLILLVMLPEQDRGRADESGGGSGKPANLSGSLARLALGDGAQTAGQGESDDGFATEAREARIDRLIAERLTELKAASRPSPAPAAATAGVRATFGKRR